MAVSRTSFAYALVVGLLPFASVAIGHVIHFLHAFSWWVILVGILNAVRLFRFVVDREGRTGLVRAVLATGLLFVQWHCFIGPYYAIGYALGRWHAEWSRLDVTFQHVIVNSAIPAVGLFVLESTLKRAEARRPQTPAAA